MAGAELLGGRGILLSRLEARLDGRLRAGERRPPRQQRDARRRTAAPCKVDYRTQPLADDLDQPARPGVVRRASGLARVEAFGSRRQSGSRLLAIFSASPGAASTHSTIAPARAGGGGAFRP